MIGTMGRIAGAVSRRDDVEINKGDIFNAIWTSKCGKVVYGEGSFVVWTDCLVPPQCDSRGSELYGGL